MQFMTTRIDTSNINFVKEESKEQTLPTVLNTTRVGQNKISLAGVLEKMVASPLFAGRVEELKELQGASLPIAELGVHLQTEYINPLFNDCKENDGIFLTRLSNSIAKLVGPTLQALVAEEKQSALEVDILQEQQAKLEEKYRAAYQQARTIDIKLNQKAIETTERVIQVNETAKEHDTKAFEKAQQVSSRIEPLATQAKSQAKKGKTLQTAQKKLEEELKNTFTNGTNL